MDGGVSASPWTTRRGLRPWHVRTLLGREPGDLAAGRKLSNRPASGRRGAIADDERPREVRPCHSVCLTADASGGLKSHSARDPGLISEGGGNASPARRDGRYGEAREARRRKPGQGKGDLGPPSTTVWGAGRPPRGGGRKA